MNNLFTSSFKRKGIKLTLFCASYLIGFLGISYVLINVNVDNKPLLETIQPKYSFYRNLCERSFTEMSTPQKYDYVFLGSSHCYRSFDPSFFESNNLKTYNLGSSSQTPLNTYFLLEKHIESSTHFILEVYPITMAISGFEAYNDHLVASNDYCFLAQTAFALNDAQAIQSLLFKPFINDRLKKKTFNDSSFYKGYEYTLDSIKNSKIKYDTIILHPEKLEKQFKYLEKIAQLCANKNKTLILVYAPIPKEIVFLNEALYKEKMNALCEEYHLKFFDYGRNHQLNSKTNFFDKDHLNKSGVKIFNERLLLDLKNTTF